jgi:hypothetical protein
MFQTGARPCELQTIEPVFLSWKGLLPRCLATHRVYVDPGASLFNQTMKGVPLLSPKQQAYVSKEVRDTSLTSMLGVASSEDEVEKAKLQWAAAEAAAEAVAEADADVGLDQPGGGTARTARL